MEVQDIAAPGGVTRRPWQTAAMRGRVGREPIRRERTVDGRESAVETVGAREY